MFNKKCKNNAKNANKENFQVGAKVYLFYFSERENANNANKMHEKTHY
jgi:hypothetical protein